MTDKEIDIPFENIGLIWGACVGWMVYRLYQYLSVKTKVEGLAELYTERRALLLAEGVGLTYVAIIIYAVVKTIL